MFVFVSHRGARMHPFLRRSSRQKKSRAGSSTTMLPEDSQDERDRGCRRPLRTRSKYRTGCYYSLVNELQSRKQFDCEDSVECGSTERLPSAKSPRKCPQRRLSASAGQEDWGL